LLLISSVIIGGINGIILEGLSECPMWRRPVAVRDAGDADVSRDVSQVSHRALRTYHTHFTAFRSVSHTSFASLVRSTPLLSPARVHTRFAHRFAVFRGHFASVALDASMQPRCHNLGIRTQHDSNSKYSKY
jgi:hypothetical protein